MVDRYPPEQIKTFLQTHKRLYPHNANILLCISTGGIYTDSNIREIDVSGEMSPQIVEHVTTDPIARSSSPVFDVRGYGWENISVPVPNNVEQALNAANLNWKVLPRPVIIDGEIIKSRVGNVRSDLPPGKNFLEVVGSKYKIVQNIDALAFIQDIIETGFLKLERGGMLAGGRSVYLIAKTDGLTVGGEPIEPYVVLRNSHDGTGKVQVALITERIACLNMLTLAIEGAPRKFEVLHTKSAEARMKAARASMNFIGSYLTAYPMFVERMIDTPISEKGLEFIANTLFPVPAKTDTNKRAVENAQENHDMFAQIYNDTPDLKQHVGTAWGVYNALADYASHITPKRNTEAFEQNRFAHNVNGLKMERAQAVIMKAALIK